MRSHLLTVPLCALILLSSSTANAQTKPIDASFRVSGSLNDLHHRSQRGGMTFDCRFQNISYEGQVTRAALEQKSSDEATLWLGLKDLRLTIQATGVAGSVGQAQCGPMQLAIGHRSEIWIAFDLQRHEQDGTPRLAVRGTRFQLPPDNYAVGAPAWVRTSGVFLNQQNVTEGLRNGMTENRAKIEGRMIAAAPALLNTVCQAAADPNSAEARIVDAVRKHLLQPARPAAEMADEVAARSSTAPQAMTAQSRQGSSQAATPRRRPRPLGEATVSR